MPTIKNCTNEAVQLLGWTLFPNSSKAVNNAGEVVEELSADIAYSEQAKYLANQALVMIDGYVPTIVPRSLGTVVQAEPEVMEYKSEPPKFNVKDQRRRR